MSAPQRLPWLDWLRGFAVLVMIQSHVFHSMTRPDLRQQGGYALSQFIGGLAAPLFLFLAGFSAAIRLDTREQKGLGPLERFADFLKRAGYIFLIAILFRLQLWIFQLSLAAWPNIFRVDILNCMALALLASAPLALLKREKRFAASAILGLGIAGLAPVVCALDWSAVPWTIRNYFVPSPNCFSFFPCAAYVPLGMAAGQALWRANGDRIETAMRWCVLLGIGLLYAGYHFSSLPYSIYPKSDFWRNSPGLIVIRSGVIVVGLAVAFIVTRFHLLGAAALCQLGKTSLLVYWVHVELVYGYWLVYFQKHLTIGEAGLAAIAVAALMYCLSIAKTRWVAARQQRRPSVTGKPLPAAVTAAELVVE